MRIVLKYFFYKLKEISKALSYALIGILKIHKNQWPASMLTN